MKTTPKINTSTDYDQFKHFESNRKVMESHVDTLFNDPEFPEKIPTHPIVVNADLYIIDGQHRFHACRRLGIPIYYVIDPNGVESDVIRLNTQMRVWKTIDYLRHYAQTIDSYKFFLEIMEKFSSLSITIHLTLITGVTHGSSHRVHQLIKKGEFKINEEGKKLVLDFYNIYIPFLKELKAVKGVASMPFFQAAYLASIVNIYETDIDTFNKIMKKALITNMPFPNYNSMNEATEFLLRLSNWRPSRVGFRSNESWDQIG